MLLKNGLERKKREMEGDPLKKLKFECKEKDDTYLGLNECRSKSRNQVELVKFEKVRPLIP